MGVSTVKLNGSTLMSVADTTALASDVAVGKDFYAADGEKTTGTSTGGGITAEALANSTVSGSINLGTATTVRRGLFYGCTGISEIIGNSVTLIEQDGFRDCRVTSLSLPSLQTLGGFGLSGVACNVYLPSLTSTTGGQVLGYNYGGGAGTPLDIAIVLPSITTLANDSFRATYVKYYDLGEGLTAIPIRCFYMGSPSATIILRNATQVVVPARADALQSVNANTTIYIPKALYDHLGDGTELDYRATSVWSDKTTTAFECIEGSQFEHFYADGTPIE